MTDQTITCPKCGKQIPVTQALRSQVEAELRPLLETEHRKHEKEIQAEFDKRLLKERENIEKRVRKQAEDAFSLKLTKLQSDLDEAKKKEKSNKENFDRRLAEERSRLSKEVKKEVESEFTDRFKELSKTLRTKDSEIAEIRQKQTETEASKQKLEKQFNSELKKQTEQAIQNAVEKTEEEYRSRELQLEHQVSEAKKQASELKKQASELKRKLDQSSQQTQGEVEELALENVLKKAFPDDEVKAVTKGKLGADILQTVFDQERQPCGSILWECKSTRSWSKSWLPKLRNDQRRAKAHASILISRVLPKEVHHFGMVDGVWLAEYPLALGVGTALRINLIQAAHIRRSIQSNHDKKRVDELFEYLSGIEFKQRVEAIVEAFTTMQDDLVRERQTMEKVWAKREKQLGLIIQNTAGMHGELEVIVGPTLARVPRLELLTD